jgi:hypothetical protein
MLGAITQHALSFRVFPAAVAAAACVSPFAFCPERLAVTAGA